MGSDKTKLSKNPRIYWIEVLLLFLIAIETSAVPGEWVQILGVPFAGLIRQSFWLVPVAALLSCVVPHWLPSWLRCHGCRMLMLSAICLPVAVFYFGTREITLSARRSEELIGLGPTLRKDLGFPVLVISDSGGTHIYFRRAHNPSLVRDSLARYNVRSQ